MHDDSGVAKGTFKAGEEMYRPMTHRLPAAEPVHGHSVVFYEDEAHLASSVLDHVTEGLARDEGLLLVQDLDRQERILRALTETGHDVARLEAEGRLVRHDAQKVLDEVFVKGAVRKDAFDRVVVAAYRNASDGGARPVRAVGELVDLLWGRNEYEAALSLEHMWEELLAGKDANLICSYPTTLLEPGDAPVQNVVSVHGGRVAVRARSRLDAAVLHALDDLFGTKRAAEIRRRIPVDMPENADLGTTEQVTFWVRRHLPTHAEALMERAKTFYQTEIALP